MSCEGLLERLGVLYQFENSVDMVAPAHIGFNHTRGELRCHDCGHEWKLDRVRHFRQR